MLYSLCLARLLDEYCGIPVLLIILVAQCLQRQIELVDRLENVDAYAMKGRAGFLRVDAVAAAKARAFVAQSAVAH